MQERLNDMTRINYSIHPRVVTGRTRYEKVNTSGTKSRRVINRVAKAISEHLERHPNDGMSQRHLASLQAKHGE